MANSRTAVSGPVLTSEQQYRMELGSILALTQEQEQALVQRARLGEDEARQQVICALLPSILPIAVCYARRAQHCDLLDLCQEAALAVIGALDRALASTKPFVYLRSVARKTLASYLRMRDSLIVKKHHGDYQQPAFVVESLEVPIEAESGLMWADVLVAVSSPASGEEVDGRREWLYQAVEHLTLCQRVVIERHYGLNGEPAELLGDIDVDVTGRVDPKIRTACGRKHKALASLRRQLEGCA